MYEQERINLYNKLSEAMARSTKKMLHFKEKLGENVIIADANGMPKEVTAADALKLYAATEQ